jgi:tRNA (cmo5U34)-methyltransferase
MKRDTLYANPLGEVSRFAFDQQVVDVFPDMIKRSVPGYATIINMIGNLAGIYAKANTHCYDLGCSLGAATLAMRHGIRNSDCKIIGVDNSQAMIDRCKQLIATDTTDVNVELINSNIQEVDIQNASIVCIKFHIAIYCS